MENQVTNNLLLTTTTTSTGVNNLSASNKDTGDQISGNHSNNNNTTNNGLLSARSIGSINESLSFDLLDQLKLSNGSDIDSEGYSIRPDSSIGMRRKNDKVHNKDNDDMNNLYASSSTDSDSDDSDSENNSSTGGPVKVMLKIKPKSEVVDKPQSNDADVLREISKNLQLKPTLSGSSSQLNSSKNVKKRTYYYNYGTANPDQAASGYSTSNLSENQCSLNMSKNESGLIGAPPSSNASMTRSVSVGSVVSGSNFLADFSSFNNSNQPSPPKPANTSVLNNSESLLDFGKLSLFFISLLWCRFLNSQIFTDSEIYGTKEYFENWQLWLFNGYITKNLTFKKNFVSGIL